ncbi:UNVERIFIED_ORG: hypothetical protein ABID75_006066 [Bacillus proteolyticus]|nr:hypothetical protein HFD78_26765 [Bacillus sp. EKM501B]
MCRNEWKANDGSMLKEDDMRGMGMAAIVKKQMIIANINLLLAMYYFCSGSLLYLCTLWET